MSPPLFPNKHLSEPPDLLMGFPPLIDAHTHTLILGSFPGVASLQAQQYYAHPQNQFWRLLSAVLEVDLPTLAYRDRLAQLLAHGLGLWDVFQACRRDGSLDAAIRQGQINDFAAVQEQCQQLQRLCFNGRTAAKMAPHFQQAGYQTVLLPSSSPAYASLRFEDKLKVWQQLRPDSPFAASLG